MFMSCSQHDCKCLYYCKHVDWQVGRSPLTDWRRTSVAISALCVTWALRRWPTPSPPSWTWSCWGQVSGEGTSRGVLFVVVLLPDMEGWAWGVGVGALKPSINIGCVEAGPCLQFTQSYPMTAWNLRVGLCQQCVRKPHSIRQQLAKWLQAVQCFME